MKAMTCPQCGALIRKISLKDKFAECDYCEARILLADNRDRIVEMPDKPEAPAQPPLTPYQQYQENYRKLNERVKQYDASDTDPQEPRSSTFLSGAVVLLALVLFVGGGFVLLAGGLLSSRPASLADKTPVKTAAPSPSVQKYPAPTPVPRITYEVKVQWSGANDMEHFEKPQIENEKLPTLDEKELKKTVFKNRGVQVRITINTDGEVTGAEAVSGHPVLAEAAVAAAKKTLFNSRAKPATRILTYYFRLITE
jgi:hypothetical protein